MRRCICLLSVLILLGGCIATPDEPEASSLTRDVMLTDYDYMWENLYENYPFFAAAQRVYGIDAKTVQEQYRSELARIPDTDIRGFYHVMTRCLAEFKMAGHLRTDDLYIFDLYHEIATQNNDAGMNVSLFLNHQVSAFYNQLREQLNQSPSSPTTPDLTPDEYAASISGLHWDHDIPVITFSSFSTPNLETLEVLSDRFTSYIQESRKSDNIIIDLRGNSGGNTSVWENGICNLFAKNEVRITHYGAYKNGDYNRKIFYIDPLTETSVPRSENVKMEVECWPISRLDALQGAIDVRGVIPTDMQGLDYLVSGSYVFPFPTSGAPYDGKLWILTDKFCASSTDDLILWAKQLGNVTTIGEKTRGLGGSLFQPTISQVMLPGSGLVISYQPYYVFSPDDSCLDFGINPNIPVPDTEDALTVCLNEIENHN